MQHDERYCEAILESRENVGADLAVFRFKPADSLTFKPGQYATVGVAQDADRPLLRPYSVVSAPHEELLEVFVEQADEGKFTPHLWTVDQGETCWIRRRIVGRFILQEDAAEKHLMAATVTGIGPYVSMIRDRIHKIEQDDPVRLTPMLVIHGASHPHEFGPYADELRTYAGRYDWLDYVPTISRPWEHAQWQGEKGRVGDIFRKVADGLSFTTRDVFVYACGHPGMISNVHGIMQRAGLDKERFLKEEYFRD